MRRRRRLLVVLTVAGLLLVTGTSALSSASLHRGIDVKVADDEDAYLGLELHDKELRNGETEESVLTLENRFNQRITVRVDIGAGTAGKPPKLLKYDDTVELAPGEQTTLDAKFVCSAVDGRAVHRTETWPITIEAVGDSVRTELERTLTVECNALPPTRSVDNGSQSNDSSGNSSAGTSPENKTN